MVKSGIILLIILLFPVVSCSPLSSSREDTAAISFPSSPLENFGFCLNFLESDPLLREKRFQLMDDLGIKAVRIPFPWKEVQPRRGNFRWEKYDKVVEEFASHNIKILALLTASPSWASSSYTPVGASPPDEIGDFANFVRETVRRYKGRVKFWEIWNEPNVPRFWGGRKSTPEEFVALLREGYRACKNEDPGAMVIMGGIAVGKDLSYLEGVFQAGGLKYCDAVGVHIYPPNPGRLKERMEEIRSLMRKFGAKQRVWITEVGWPSKSLNRERLKELLVEKGVDLKKARRSLVFRIAVGAFYGFSREEALRARSRDYLRKELRELGLTEEEFLSIMEKATENREEEQAKYLLGTYRLLEEDYLGKIFWYQFCDPRRSFHREGNFGIVDYKLSPKPAYIRLKRETKKE